MICDFMVKINNQKDEKAFIFHKSFNIAKCGVQIIRKQELSKGDCLYNHDFTLGVYPGSFTRKAKKSFSPNP